MIEVKNLKMLYGTKEVLKNISFKIEEGKTVGLLGSNGAGKSTTMNILTGYLKPEAGEIIVNGVDMRKSPKEAKKQIGYLPELPPLYKDMKVFEYLLFVADLKGVSDKKREVRRVIDLMNLKECRFDYIKKLSKGVQQRVGFAQCLIGNPKVLILDEPLVGLDPVESKKTRELIRSLQGEHIIIISSHVLKEIEELCDTILMLKDGEIVLDGSTTDTKRRNGKNIYRVLVKGNVTQIEETLKDYAALKEVCILGEQESGVYEFLLKSKNNRDIRDNILSYLMSKKFHVYGIEKLEDSLEDIFVEMNSEVEA